MVELRAAHLAVTLSALALAPFALPGDCAAETAVSDVFKDWSMTAKTFRLDGYTNTSNRAASGNYSTWGQTLAIDHQVTEILTLGLVLGRTGDIVHYKQIDRRMEVEGKSLGVHAVVDTDPIRADLLLSKGWNSYSTAFPSSLHANWSGDEWAFDSQVSYKAQVHSVHLAPLFGFHHQELDQSRYTTGGFFGTTTPAQSRSYHQARLGLNARTEMVLSEASGVVLGFFGGGVLKHGFNHHPAFGPASEETGLAGGSFTFDLPSTEPPKFPSSFSNEERIGAELRIGDSVEISVGGVWHNNAMASWHGIVGSLTVKFP